MNDLHQSARHDEGEADVVEAMLSHRPFRPARALETALAEIRDGRGKLFDVEAVNACLALFARQEFAVHLWDEE